MEEGKQYNVKVNVSLDLETVNRLDELASRVRREIRERKRSSPGPGRPVGAGSIVAAIFKRAMAEHPEWLEQWYETGLAAEAKANELPAPAPSAGGPDWDRNHAEKMSRGEKGGEALRKAPENNRGKRKHGGSGR